MDKDRLLSPSAFNNLLPTGYQLLCLQACPGRGDSWELYLVLRRDSDGAVVAQLVLGGDTPTEDADSVQLGSPGNDGQATDVTSAVGIAMVRSSPITPD